MGITVEIASHIMNKKDSWGQETQKNNQTRSGDRVQKTRDGPSSGNSEWLTLAKTRRREIYSEVYMGCR